MVDIGSKYEENRRRLARKIFGRELELCYNGNNFGNYVCYFCSHGIKGRVFFVYEKVVVNGIEFENKCFIDKGCYNLAKLGEFN